MRASSGTHVASVADMRHSQTSHFPVAAFIALVLAAGCSSSDDDASLLIDNESDFAITELYITEVDNPDYGRNLLAGDLLLPGEELFVPVSCDFYDVLLFDEEGVPCELFDIDLCLNNATFIIENQTCTVFEAGRKTSNTARWQPEERDRFAREGSVSASRAPHAPL